MYKKITSFIREEEFSLEIKFKILASMEEAINKNIKERDSFLCTLFHMEILKMFPPPVTLAHYTSEEYNKELKFIMKIKFPELFTVINNAQKNRFYRRKKEGRDVFIPTSHHSMAGWDVGNKKRLKAIQKVYNKLLQIKNTKDGYIN